MEWWHGLPVGNEIIGIVIVPFCLCTNLRKIIYRTDAEVHSMDNPVVVYLQRRYFDDSYYDPKYITYIVNDILIRKGVDLRYFKIVFVFHSKSYSGLEDLKNSRPKQLINSNISIFAISKMAKKSIFELGKSLKLPKMQFHEKKFFYLFNFTSFLPGLF